MNILVTGSSGWLGQTLVPRLKRDGHTVVGLDPGAGPARPTSWARSSTATWCARSSASSASRPSSMPRRAAQAAYRDARQFGVRRGQRAGHAQPAGGGDGAGLDGRPLRLHLDHLADDLAEDPRRHKRGGASEAFWIDESMAPLEPRNIYGVTKLAAEHLCRLVHHAAPACRSSSCAPRASSPRKTTWRTRSSSRARTPRPTSSCSAASRSRMPPRRTSWRSTEAPADRLRHLHHLGADAVQRRRIAAQLIGDAPLGRARATSRAIARSTPGAAGRCSTTSTGSTIRTRRCAAWASSARTDFGDILAQLDREDGV